MNDIIDSIGLPAVLEMLGEEGAEMTHASLKWARQLRGENPTPKTEEECREALVEEMADVQLMIDLLTMSGIIGDAEIRTRMGQKMLRWLDRMEAQNEDGRDHGTGLESCNDRQNKGACQLTRLHTAD